jgi:hypothetical protein
VVHACNPSHSGGRDQEDRGLKSAGETLSRKTLHKNRVGEVAQGEGPEFKPSTGRKKKKPKNQKFIYWRKTTVNSLPAPLPQAAGAMRGEDSGNLTLIHVLTLFPSL